MPGALTHIVAGVLAAALVHYYHFRFEYSLSVFVGSVLPDAVKFGLTAIKQLTWSVFYVEQDGFFQTLASLTSNPVNWLTLGVFVASLSWLLYHFHVIKKKKMREYDELFLFLFGGILFHLVLDAVIQERGPWL